MGWDGMGNVKVMRKHGRERNHEVRNSICGWDGMESTGRQNQLLKGPKIRKNKMSCSLGKKGTCVCVCA